jgi:hypothetical protein
MEVGRLTGERDVLAMRVIKLQQQTGAQVDRIKEEVSVYAGRLMRMLRCGPLPFRRWLMGFCLIGLFCIVLYSIIFYVYMLFMDAWVVVYAYVCMYVY